MGLATLWIRAPELYRGVDASTRASAVATTRTGIFAALAGLAAIASLIVNARSLAETQRANRDAHQRELEVQVTDRYTKAITQLGDRDSLAIRLGGIYALERIAIDSARDHRTVVEVLSAYVRVGTRSPPGDQDEPRTPPALGADLRAALTVLGRLPDRPDTPRRPHRSQPGQRSARRSEPGRCQTRQGEPEARRAQPGGSGRCPTRLGEPRRCRVRWGEHDRCPARRSGPDWCSTRRDGPARAWLYGANLTGATCLSAAQIATAGGDESTRLPAGLAPPAFW